MTALRWRVLKDSGIDPEKLTLEDVAIQNLELKDEIRSIKAEKRKVSVKDFINRVVIRFAYPKKQKALLKALSSYQPVKERLLIDKTGTADSESLRNLVRETRKRIAKVKNGKETIIIKPLRGNPHKGYKLEIRSPFVKSPTTKT